MNTNTSNKETRYIFVCGGVMSGVGKGITTASLGAVLQSYGLNVTLMKADPYLNVDAGTMNPIEHGEVFVMDSGLETDQDMGNYERFLNRSLPPENYMTNGMVFLKVIQKERALGYKGKCVEPTYHITEEILRRMDACVEANNNPEIVIVEVGGTVGEYQNAIFLEAARQIKLRNPKNVQFVMVSYLPTPAMIGEMKTKPTQNAVRQLNSYGIHPDFIIARANVPLDEKRREKISNMCGIPLGNVVSAPDAKSIFQVPLNFQRDNIGKSILEGFGITGLSSDLEEWKKMVQTREDQDQKVNIAVIGKYFATGDFVLSDVYVSVLEALKGAAASVGVTPEIEWISSQDYENGTRAISDLDNYDGVLIPGGFGSTGIEGKLKVIQYVREYKIPYFGICYGMQLMVVEYARVKAGLPEAHTIEINSETPDPVVTIIEEQKELLKNNQFGGTMRLGSCSCMIQENTKAFEIYKSKEITERHRHRYEVNPDYIKKLEESGLVFSGKSPDGILMEIAELQSEEHPFMVGVQFHPEFLARPLDPHPVFRAFIEASLENKKS